MIIVLTIKFYDMINITKASKYCSEDISLIENYDKAVKDTTQTWHCHHRKETDENLTGQELMKLGLYWKRPAKELIFLTESEHRRLHMYGKHHSEETRNKQSEAQKGKPAWNRGKHTSEETRKKISEVLKGKPHSDEVKRKQSEAIKAWWAKRKTENISNNKQYGESDQKFFT